MNIQPAEVLYILGFDPRVQIVEVSPLPKSGLSQHDKFSCDLEVNKKQDLLSQNSV